MSINFDSVELRDILFAIQEGDLQERWNAAYEEYISILPSITSEKFEELKSLLNRMHGEERERNRISYLES